MKKAVFRDNFSGIIKALGLVFGDIGTSPIYTLTVISLFVPKTTESILGVLSLIIWSLVVLVFVEYVMLAMSLEVHGEGGTLILKRILDDIVKKTKSKNVVAVVAFIGVSLLLGDGVITPSISILSAVEGMVFIPGLEHIQSYVIIAIAMAITMGLFFLQPLGTDRVAGAFGPVMVIWFIVLATTGLYSLVQTPQVLAALNPMYAIKFFMDQKLAGFFMLSQVILCATGAEALYADMGHLGKKPIVRAWNFVFVALVLNYLGQAAFFLRHLDAKNLLFEMVQSEFPLFYTPFLILTVIATVIASQALISGVFSIVYQGINIGAFPRMKVNFTSNNLKSQIYIGTINWFLMIAVLFMLVLFKKSENLAVAYGLAVTGTMCITGIMMITIFKCRRQWLHFLLAIVVTLVDAAFFSANLVKLEHGGYWSLILASVPFSLMFLWIHGQRRVYHNLKGLDLETFLPGYTQIYKKGKNIPGSSMFFVGNIGFVPPYIIHSMVRTGIVYETNIFTTVVRSDYPFGIELKYRDDLGPGLHSFEILAGYKEDVDIEKILKASKLDPKGVFYGAEDIYTKNFIWWIYSIVKRLAPSFVKFYKVPSTKLFGIVSRVEM